MSEQGYRCHTCGQWHDALPLDVAFDAPRYWIENPESQPNGSLTSDTCVIDGNFFIRGNIYVPILDGTEPYFVWGVWTSLSERNFKRVLELWDSHEREHEPPYFGWLNSELSHYYSVSTIALKTTVQTRSLELRPFVELEPTDHPLAIEQREGITMRRVHEIIDLVMKSNATPEN
jgi:hypothetical protein